jgi:hypothetical protein
MAKVLKDSFQQLYEIADSQGGFFTAKQAASVGYSTRMQTYHVQQVTGTRGSNPAGQELCPDWVSGGTFRFYGVGNFCLGLGAGDNLSLFDYRLENDPRFLKRIENARKSIRNGRGVKLEDLES